MVSLSALRSSDFRAQSEPPPSVRRQSGGGNLAPHRVEIDDPLDLFALHVELFAVELELHAFRTDRQHRAVELVEGRLGHRFRLIVAVFDRSHRSLADNQQVAGRLAFGDLAPLPGQLGILLAEANGGDGPRGNLDRRAADQGQRRFAAHRGVAVGQELRTVEQIDPDGRLFDRLRGRRKLDRQHIRSGQRPRPGGAFNGDAFGGKGGQLAFDGIARQGRDLGIRRQGSQH